MTEPLARILLLAPDDDARARLQRLLGETFDLVETADAADIAGTERFDLIVTSLPSLPSDPVTANLPVVVLATSGKEDARIAAYEAGAADYIVLPVSDRELLARISNQARTSPARRQIELERDQFVSVAENSPYFIGVCGMDMRAFFVNSAGKRAVGIEDRDVRELNVEDFFFPEDRPFVFDEFFPSVLRDGSGEVEIRFRNFKTGAARWMLYNVFAVTGPRGERIGLATVSRDITADVTTREALRASERQQSLLVRLLRGQREMSDPAAMMAAACEEVGRALGANRVGFFEMHGEDELRFSVSWADGVLEPLTGSFPATGIGTGYLAEVRAGHTLGIADTSASPLTADSQFGEIGARSIIGAPIIRDDRWHAGLYVNHSQVREWQPDEIALVRQVADHTWDAVERARIRAALRDSEERFRQVAEHAPQFIWVTRPDGVAEYVNEPWTAYSGLDLAASNEPSNVAAMTHPDDRADVERRWEQARQTGEPIELEVRLRGKDGAFRWFLARTVPLRDDSGRLLRWFTTSTDINAQKEASRALEEIDRRKDDFLATLSHELRTPLTAGYGWVKLLEHTREAGLLDTGLHAIEQSFTTQIRLIDDLLDVSRIIAGKMQIDMEPFDLARAIDAAIEVVQPAARNREIDLRASIDAEATVNGDVARITQVVWNLLSNAIKFTPPRGVVSISVQCSNGEAKITVQDSGQGIDAKFLPYVFDRFRQADSSVNRRQGGLGLGLSIVASLVEAHGGSVKAESEGAGKGATFTVRLPVLARRELPRVVEHPHPAESILGSRVLIVDDDDGARNLMITILEGAGAEVRAFDTATAAIEVLERWHPDVLISDLSMPVDDGFSLVRGLRDSGNQVPAVAVTAYVRTEEAAHNAGFQSHLPKPFTPEALIDAVKALTRAT